MMSFTLIMILNPPYTNRTFHVKIWLKPNSIGFSEEMYSDKNTFGICGSVHMMPVKNNTVSKSFKISILQE